MSAPAVLESVTLSPGHVGAPAGSLCAKLLEEGFSVRLDLLEELDSWPAESLQECSTPEEIKALEERASGGDSWAWFMARVSISHPDAPGVEGTDYLGACSYTGAGSWFQPDGYWPDMVAEAFRAYVSAAESAAKALKVAERAQPVLGTVRVTFDTVTPESAEHGEPEESGWVDADRSNLYPVPAGQVGADATRDGSEWSTGRKASAVEFRLGADGSSVERVAESVARHVLESLAHGLDHDNGPGGRDSWSFYGCPGSMEADGSVESRAAHVEGTPEFLAAVSAAVARLSGKPARTVRA